MEQNNRPKDKVVIVGVKCQNLEEELNSTDATLDELAALVETAGGETVARAVQNRPSPDPHSYIGEGKVAEIAALAKNHGADLIVFDNELSPSQLRALEEDTDVRVLDRSGIILDIFASRARSAEGKLQVELAQYRYLLPRLTGKGIALSRQGSSAGGILTRGPGESKLETDRRHIRARIEKLERELEEVKRVRAGQRRKREKNEIPVVAIVGYTNAGKSTLLNALTGADIEANDRLFDTLDTTTRLFEVNDTLKVLLSDTVGFIRRLPHHLVSAFRATLEELAYADLILHVIDVSNPEWVEQARVTDRLADELAGKEVPRLAVFNKADRVDKGELPGGVSPYGGPIVAISAKKGEGFGLLREQIVEKLEATVKKATLLLPFDKASLLDYLHREAKVESLDYTEQGVMVSLSCDDRVLSRVSEYRVDQ